MEKEKRKQCSSSESAEPAQAKKKYSISSDSPTQHPSPKGFITFEQFRGRVCLPFEEILTEEYQSHYREKHQSEPSITYLDEHLRVFIWSLITQIQRYHDLGLCVEIILPEHIMVDEEAVPYLKGKLVMSSPQLIRKNYEEIHSILQSIFGEAAPFLSASVTHFMSLLVGALTSDSCYLIGCHVSILPSPLLCAFIVNLVLLPRGLSKAQRIDIFAAIDGVHVSVNWMRELVKDTFLKRLYDNGMGKDYMAACPFTASYYLCKFFRNAIQHCGLPKRPMFRITNEYIEWEQAQGHHEVSLSCYRSVDELAYVPVESVMKRLFSLFPNFLYEVQVRLLDLKALTFFAIKPSSAGKENITRD